MWSQSLFRKGVGEHRANEPGEMQGISCQAFVSLSPMQSGHDRWELRDF